MATRTSARLLLTAATLAATTAAGAADKDKATHDTCFYRRNIENFSAPNDHTVYLRVLNHDVYRLDLMSDCPGLSFRQAFGLEDRPSSPWICTPLDATVVYRETGITMRCPVTALHKLTPEELAALPKRDRP